MQTYQTAKINGIPRWSRCESLQALSNCLEVETRIITLRTRSNRLSACTPLSNWSQQLADRTI